eukprot:351048-Amphidinium_carterae.1
MQNSKEEASYSHQGQQQKHSSSATKRKPIVQATKVGSSQGGKILQALGQVWQHQAKGVCVCVCESLPSLIVHHIKAETIIDPSAQRIVQ